MQETTKRLAILAVAFALLSAGAVQALAGNLEDLRRAGTVGERYDGYVAIRDKNAAKDVAATVDEINAKRRALYEKRAASEGVPAEQVGRVYAKTIFDEAPAGTWFLTEDRGWVQK